MTAFLPNGEPQWYWDMIFGCLHPNLITIDYIFKPETPCDYIKLYLGVADEVKAKEPDRYDYYTKGHEFDYMDWKPNFVYSPYIPVVDPAKVIGSTGSFTLTLPAIEADKLAKNLRLYPKDALSKTVNQFNDKEDNMPGMNYPGGIRQVCTHSLADLQPETCPICKKYVDWKKSAPNRFNSVLMKQCYEAITDANQADCVDALRPRLGMYSAELTAERNGAKETFERLAFNHFEDAILAIEELKRQVSSRDQALLDIDKQLCAAKAVNDEKDDRIQVLTRANQSMADKAARVDSSAVLDSYQRRIGALTKKMNHCEGDVRRLNKLLEETQDLAMSWEEKAHAGDAANIVQINDLTDECSKWKDKVFNLTKENDQLVLGNVKLRSKISRCDKTIKSLRNTIKGMKDGPMNKSEFDVMTKMLSMPNGEAMVYGIWQSKVNQIAELNAKLVTAAKDFKIIDERLIEAKKRNQVLVTDKQVVHDQCTELDKTCKRYAHQIGMAIEEAARLRAKIKDMELAATMFEDSDKNIKTIKHLEDELVIYADSFGKAKVEIQELTHRVHLGDTYRKQLSACNDKLAEQVDALKAQKGNIEAQAVSWMNKAKKFEASSKDWQQKCYNATAGNKDTWQHVAELNKKACTDKDATIKVLRQEITHRTAKDKRDYDELQSNYNALVTTVEQLRHDKTAANVLVTQIRQELKSYMAQVDRLKHELKDIGDVEEKHNALVDACQQLKTNHKAEVTKLRSQVSTLNNSNNVHFNSWQDEVKCHNLLKEDMTRYREDTEDEFTKMNQQVSTLQQEVKELNADLWNRLSYGERINESTANTITTLLDDVNKHLVKARTNNINAWQTVIGTRQSQLVSTLVANSTDHIKQAMNQLNAIFNHPVIPHLEDKECTRHDSGGQAVLNALETARIQSLQNLGRAKTWLEKLRLTNDSDKDAAAHCLSFINTVEKRLESLLTDDAKPIKDIVARLKAVEYNYSDALQQLKKIEGSDNAMISDLEQVIKNHLIRIIVQNTELMQQADLIKEGSAVAEEAEVLITRLNKELEDLRVSSKNRIDNLESVLKRRDTGHKKMTAARDALKIQVCNLETKVKDLQRQVDKANSTIELKSAVWKIDDLPGWITDQGEIYWY